MSESKLTADELSEAAVSAPEVVTVDGRVFLVNKVTEQDAFAIYLHAKREATKSFNPIREVLDSIKDLDIDAATRTELLTTAARLKAQRAIGDEDITAWLLSPAGVSFRLWILARPNDMALTLTTCECFVTAENCLSVFADVDRASGGNLIRKAFGGSPENPFVGATGFAATAAASAATSTEKSCDTSISQPMS